MIRSPLQNKDLTGLALQMKIMADLVKMHKQFNEGISKLEEYAKTVRSHSNEMLKNVQEVKDHVARVQNLPEGKKGEKGDMPEFDVEAIKNEIMSGIPKPKDGETPDTQKIVKTVLASLPKPEKRTEAPMVDHETLADLVIEKITKGKKLKVEHIAGLTEEVASYRNQLAGKVYGKDTWARGGGDIVTAGSGISVTTDANGKKVITNTNPSSGTTYYTPTGTVNASNTVFGVTAQPTSVISDGILLFEGAGYSYAALSITLDVPPSVYIRYTL